MFALTLHQPWASLMAVEAKKIETRGWKFPYKTPAVIAIHASTYWVRENAALCDQGPFAQAFLRTTHKHGWRSVQERDRFWRRHCIDLPLGRVLAVGLMIRCIATELIDYCNPATPQVLDMTSGKYFYMTADERAFGDYREGRYAWIFDKIVALKEPVLARGGHKIWKWTPSNEALKIERELLAGAKVQQS